MYIVTECYFSYIPLLHLIFWHPNKEEKKQLQDIKKERKDILQSQRWDLKVRAMFKQS
jgi:hypothetical protein